MPRCSEDDDYEFRPAAFVPLDADGRADFDNMITDGTVQPDMVTALCADAEQEG